MILNQKKGGSDFFSDKKRELDKALDIFNRGIPEPENEQAPDNEAAWTLTVWRR